MPVAGSTYWNNAHGTVPGEASEDPEGIVIFTADGEYTEVMNRVVNIVSRTVSNVSSKASADLSFVRFVEE